MDAFCQALPSRCPPGAAQSPVDDLQTRTGPLLEPTASVPLEDPLASDCWYIGLQTEWVAFKRDAGLPLSEVLRAARRVFALDLQWQAALAGALGTLIYRAPQRSPAELRQRMEAACLAPPLFWTDARADW